MTNYRFYITINGSDYYFEWRNATEGGVVFCMSNGNSRMPVLGYDLNKVPNPTVESMYYSWWGQNMSTVYRRSGNDCYAVYSNINPSVSDNPHGYDVELQVASGSDYLPEMRAYFDSQASKPLYVGVNGKAREVTDMYVGVNGRARKVTAIYVGVNGRAREVFKET